MTIVTEKKPFSEYLATVRRALKRDRDAEALPVLTFAKGIGTGRSHSTIIRLEAGDEIRPSDEFLQEIAESYPKAADLDRMIKLRDEQFGSPEEWSARRREMKKAKAGEKRGTAAAKPPAGAKTPAGTKDKNQASAPEASKSPGGGLRERLGGATLPGQPARRVSRPGTTPWQESRSRHRDLEAAGKEAPKAEGKEAPEARGRENEEGTRTRSTRDQPGQAPGLVGEILPVLQSLASSLVPATGFRLVAAAAIMAERLRVMHVGGNQIGRVDMRAAAKSFSSDLYSALSAPGLPLLADEEEERDALLVLVDLAEDRRVARSDLMAVLSGVLMPAEEGAISFERLDLLVLRALALGARR